MAGAPVVITAAMIATATGGTLASGDPQAVPGGYSIDSRTLRPGDLFFAIVAERDGHQFVGAALERGAVGVVVHSVAGARHAARTAAAVNGEPVVIEVADTLRALQDLGRYVRRASQATVVAITGSAGKTTTKETVAEFLSASYRVIKNRGNFNNHLGLPLSLLELRHGTDVAVMELGMNHPGEIRALVAMAEPEVRVWTNVGDAHLGYFESRDAIADAKAEILEGARPGDVLICNADDPRVMARAVRFDRRRVTFGIAATADVRAENVEDLGLDGVRFTLHTPGGRAEVVTPLLGRGNLSNVLAAAAVATELKVPFDDVVRRVATLTPAAHRGAVVRLPRGLAIVDDSYNSSPAALQRVLEVVALERRARRKAAVLGEMLELGEHSIALHAECGRAAAAAGLDRLIVVGGEAAEALADAAIEAGLPADAVTCTASSSAASDLILPWLREGDLVLVKGSRGVRTDVVVERITEEFS